MTNNPTVLERKIDEILSRLQTEAKRVAAPDYHWTLHQECVNYVALDGLWLEFGVYRGRSICNLAKLTSKTIYGFDSFEGLPEKWNDENPQWVYSLGGRVPAGAIDGSNDDNPGMYSKEATKTIKPWPANVKLIPGWFDNSLPGFIAEHSEQVAFLHVDSDVYSSCRTVLTLLKNQIKPGTVILFDEICDYDTYREHEIKAFAEFLIETGYNYQPLVYQPLGYSQGLFKILAK